MFFSVGPLGFARAGHGPSKIKFEPQDFFKKDFSFRRAALFFLQGRQRTSKLELLMGKTPYLLWPLSEAGEWVAGEGKDPVDLWAPSRDLPRARARERPGVSNLP